MEKISEEEDINEDAHGEFIISDKFYSNDPDSNTWEESLISTP